MRIYDGDVGRYNCFLFEAAISSGCAYFACQRTARYSSQVVWVSAARHLLSPPCLVHRLVIEVVD